VNVVAVVQARVGSQRLPGKVLMDLAGRPMIAQLLRRLTQAELVDEVVVATTTSSADDEVARVTEAEGVRVFRGSEHDVLGRMTGAAAERNADLVVRITGDCPLVDPAIVDRVVGALIEHRTDVDLASNIVRRTFPKGLDTEALYFDALRRIERLGASSEAREHVTWFAYRERPDLFAMHSVEEDDDHSELNWSVDTAEDFERVASLYEQLDLGTRLLGWREILAASR
jgi:spore coat polysaccharide biosynthesis protein SpsF (cytidylyltransferase family)